MGYLDNTGLAYLWGKIKAKIVQSDWQQNDESAPDYVKNRPGGYMSDPVRGTPLFENKNFTFAWNDNFNANAIEIELPTKLIEGVVYDVGLGYSVADRPTVYRITCWSQDGVSYLGNPSIIGIGSNLGQSFLVADYSDKTLMFLSSGLSASDTYQAFIAEFAPLPVKIPQKYLELEGYAKEENAILSTPQTLTDAQKQQARENIGVVQADCAENDSTSPAYVKNRLAWTEVNAEAVNITWDGEIGDKTTVTLTLDEESFVWAKVSDEVLSVAQINGCIAEQNTGDIDQISDATSTDVFYELVVFVATPGWTYSQESSGLSITFPEAGVYFAKFTPAEVTEDTPIRYITSLTRAADETVHQIDPKYIDKDAVRQIPVFTGILKNQDETDAFITAVNSNPFVFCSSGWFGHLVITEAKIVDESSGKYMDIVYNGGQQMRIPESNVGYYNIGNAYNGHSWIKLEMGIGSYAPARIYSTNNFLASEDMSKHAILRVEDRYADATGFYHTPFLVTGDCRVVATSLRLYSGQSDMGKLDKNPSHEFYITDDGKPALKYLPGNTHPVKIIATEDDLAAKADKPTTTEATLLATGWTGTSAPYSYTLSVTGVTADSHQELLPALDITAAQLTALQAANIQDDGQAEGTVTLKAFGTKPTIDLPIRVLH